MRRFIIARRAPFYNLLSLAHFSHVVVAYIVYIVGIYIAHTYYIFI